MINIDTRLLDDITADQFWLLCHIVKRFDEKLICWPSNKTLCSDTKWSLKKMQGIKAQLIEKGVLIAKVRYFDKSQSSNEYMINTELLGVYVPAKRMPVGLQTPASNLRTPPASKIHTAHESERDNKVLTIEVLENISTGVDAPKNELFSESQPLSNELPNTGTAGKKAKGHQPPAPVDECYADFVDAWTKQYPELGFDAISGRMIKQMIRHTKDLLRAADKVPDRAATVNSFKYVLAYVSRGNEPHFVHGKPITTFAHQYRSVALEIKTGKQKPASQRPSVFSKYAR